MPPLDPERKTRYEVGFEATSAEDVKPSDLNLNKRSTRRPTGSSLAATAKRDARATSAKQQRDADEDELTMVSPPSRAHNSHVTTRRDSSTGSITNVRPVRRLGGYVRDALQRYGLISQSTPEETSHIYVPRDVEGQPSPASSLSPVSLHDKGDNGGPTTDVGAVVENYERELARLSAQSEQKEAYYQDKISRLEANSNGLSARLKEMELHYKGTISKLETQKTQLTAEWTQKESQYHDKISSLETQNSKNASKAMALQRQLDAACADFSKELAEAQSKNSFEQVKATDTEIQGSWKTLAFSVRQFVQAHCPTSFSSTTLKELHIISRLPNLNHLCDNPELVLQSPLFAQSLMEACVWAYLYQTIFSPQAEYWAGTVGKNFVATCTSIQDLMRSEKRDSSSLLPAFHQWRSDSMHHLQRLGAIRKPDMEGLATSMIRYLAPIMNQTAHGLTSSAPAKEAIDIIAAATNIDKIFRMSKADYTVILSDYRPPYRPPLFGFPFNPYHMEEKSEFAGFVDRSGSSAPLVDLALSPAVLKAGNIEGNNYHSEQFLMKLEVVCGLQKFLSAAKKNEVKIAQSPGNDVSAVGSRTHHKSNVSSAGQKRASYGSGGSSDIDMLGSPNKYKKREDK